MYWRERRLKSQLKKMHQPILNRNKEIVKYETLMRIRDINNDGEAIYLSPYLFRYFC